MGKIALVTIGLMLLLFTLPMMSAIGGMGTVSNVSGNLTKLDFTISTIQNTSNPGIGQNITYITSINISSRGHAKFNLTNFSFNFPDNNTFNSNVSIWITNETGTITNETPDEFWIGQAAGQYSWVVFYGMDACSNASVADNGTRNSTTWNITWTAMAPIGSTFIGTSLTGRTYTSTWNITNENSNLTVTNASIVQTPGWWDRRIGAPTAVLFNSTAFTTYSTNYTNFEGWTDLILDGGTSNMIKLASGYATLSVAYNGPTISSSSGSSPSSAVSVVPTQTRRIGLWLIIGLGIISIVVITVFLAVRKK